MQITDRNIGQDQDNVTPKPLNTLAGLDDQRLANVRLENSADVLQMPATSVRVGWAEAAQALASQGKETLLMEEFDNLDNAEFAW